MLRIILDKGAFMKRTRCECCESVSNYLQPVFIGYVCETCKDLLKDIAQGKQSRNLGALCFYIRMQAIFISKSEGIETSRTFEAFDIDQLNVLAQFFARVSKNSFL